MASSIHKLMRSVRTVRKDLLEFLEFNQKAIADQQAHLNHLEADQALAGSISAGLESMLQKHKSLAPAP